jgi:hypothetical protein
MAGRWKIILINLIINGFVELDSLRIELRQKFVTQNDDYNCCKAIKGLIISR